MQIKILSQKDLEFVVFVPYPVQDYLSHMLKKKKSGGVDKNPRDCLLGMPYIASECIPATKETCVYRQLYTAPMVECNLSVDRPRSELVCFDMAACDAGRSLC